MQQTIANRTIYCHDNLKILQGIDTGTINLIYLDPPFNKKKVFTAPIGTSAEGASFRDIFRQEDVEGGMNTDHKRRPLFTTPTTRSGKGYKGVHLL